jgi:thioredoxin reductase
MNDSYQIVIIGAGAAGIGFGVTLKELGIDDFVILEQEEIGSSFLNWPAETRFITPSFTSNGFGMPDLNAVSVHTSPAYTLEKERLSGKHFAQYLKLVAESDQLPIKEHTKVSRVEPEGDSYQIETNVGQIKANFVIFAVGEYHYPNLTDVEGGAEHTIHYSQVQTWQDLEGEEFLIIGGNESAIDAAIQLIKLGKKVHLYTSSSDVESEHADPSLSLSAHTNQRLNLILDDQTLSEKFELTTGIRIQSVSKDRETYVLETHDGEILTSVTKPINCIGFDNGALAVAPNLFAIDSVGRAVVNQVDESVVANNLFLIGPSLVNENVIFCFIYKFRQRFAVIAEEIARRKHIAIDFTQLEYYRQENFYLDDCSNCAVNCDC